MRQLFNFAPTYMPLNHGSFGTYPTAVLEYRQQLLRDWEARECIYAKWTYPKLLKESRALIAPLLGVDTDEIVLVPNATTGINTVLRNLVFEAGDVVLFPSTTYSANLKTIQSLEETTPVRGHQMSIVYPVEDDQVVELFRTNIEALVKDGKRVRVAIFDTISSRPGVRVPWERLVSLCRQLGVLSMVDAAHAVGHIDMTHTRVVKPDFLVSNCYKWLYVPRGCVVLYVPFANQHFIKTSLPTSNGYLDPKARKAMSSREYFVNLFAEVSTSDTTPFITIPAALQFRNNVCGGEAAIREYCYRLAFDGGNRVAEMLGTEVLENTQRTLRPRCMFANIRLPVTIVPAERGVQHPNDNAIITEDEVERVLAFIYTKLATELDTSLMVFAIAQSIWTRFSAQIYLEMSDFEWGARMLLNLCERIRAGEWKEEEDRVLDALA
ncbi:aminotransferase family protein-like protein [Podospora didyma]|uniref:Aminotransferase family protein-like protein n=1 Tax=Podospora didyma TaxID=330526 RepID=A0AAE0N901_9PEZI|nr:aminotransferase family protein-like protein [Podospora didyma]